MKWLTLMLFLFAPNFVELASIKKDYNIDQNLSFEDQTFNKYNQDLSKRYNNRNYLSAIYQDAKTRDDFSKFLNEGLTQQTKDDLAGLRIYKKIGDGVEVPVVMFSPQMDNWLGILPHWKRTKRYIFKKIEQYLSLHPELLNRKVPIKV